MSSLRWWVMSCVVAMASSSLGRAASLVARSPFSETGEVDALAETNAHLYVVQLNLEIMAKNPPGPSPVGTYSVYQINKATGEAQAFVVTEREQFLDGGTRIVHFVSRDQPALLFLPDRMNGISYAIHNPKLNNIPVLVVGDDKIPLTYHSIFPLETAAKEKLIGFYKPIVIQKYRTTGKFPTIDPMFVMKSLNQETITLKSILAKTRQWLVRTFF